MEQGLTYDPSDEEIMKEQCIYADSNLTLADDGHIRIGGRVMYSPNVTVRKTIKNNS